MLKHHTRARMLAHFGPGRGPAWRTAPGDGGEPTPGGGDGGTGDGSKDGEPGGTGDGSEGGSKPKIEGEYDKDRAASTIAAARDGEKKAKERATAAEKSVAELKESLAVSLGLKPDPKSDPTALAAQAAKELAEAKAEVVALKAASTLDRVAPKAGGDADELRDSTKFMAQLKELDPDAADYADKVTAAVKAAVKANPRLGATGGTPGRQGADITPSGGGRGGNRSSNLDDAVKRKLGGS